VQSIFELTVAAYVEVARAVLRPVVPLASGVLSVFAAWMLYAVFVPSGQAQDFFSAAAQVDVGVLVALMLAFGAERSLRRPTWLERQARVGILVLTAIGTASSLTGTLVTGSDIASGVLFGFSWGGTTAGVTGLFLLLLDRVDKDMPRVANATDDEQQRAEERDDDM
jgi:hypothetical protein